MHRIASKFLTISSEGGSTASLGSQSQCLMKKFFLMFRTSWAIISAPCLLPYQLGRAWSILWVPSSQTLLDVHEVLHQSFFLGLNSPTLSAFACERDVLSFSLTNCTTSAEYHCSKMLQIKHKLKKESRKSKYSCVRRTGLSPRNLEAKV